MSHVIDLKTQFHNLDVLQGVCDSRQVQFRKGQVTEKLFEGPVTGVASFHLKGWKYPAVVQADGSCKADTYNGAWGKQSAMDELAHDYGCEVARDFLVSQGCRLECETVEEDGTRELVYLS